MQLQRNTHIWLVNSGVSLQLSGKGVKLQITSHFNFQAPLWLYHDNSQQALLIFFFPGVFWAVAKRL